MAKALECPACGARYRIDSLPDAPTFRCDRCGQVLKVPDAVDSLRNSTVPPTAASAATSTDAGVPAPPPRRGGSAATGPRVSATATATLPATAAAAAGTAAPSPDGPPEVGARAGRDGGERSSRRKVHWYWRVLAWIAAIPLGLLITAWPALHFDLLKRDDLVDVFVGEGTGRYLRLLVFAAAWALVTALLVQLLVEGGRWWANRRRARARTRTPVPV